MKRSANSIRSELNARDARRNPAGFEMARFDRWCEAHPEKPRKAWLAVWEGGFVAELGKMPVSVRRVLGI